MSYNQAMVSKQLRWTVFLIGLSCWGASAQGLGDLVVGKIERNPKGLVIYYQNQGPGRLEGRSVSLRLSDSKEKLTVDNQPLPREPLQICHTATIPFAKLGMQPKDFFALTVDIDPRDQIKESKEHNNQYFQQSNEGTINEYPDFSVYPGQPKLSIKKIEVVGPGELMVQVVNQGQGVTMCGYSLRLTIDGVSNNLVDHHYQPLAQAGQSDNWIFRFERWGVKNGQTVQLKAEVDPDHRLPGSTSARETGQTVSRQMQLGPKVESMPAPVSGQVQAAVQTPAFKWRAKSSYLCWAPNTHQLSVNFFPFQLRQADLLGLLYNDPQRTVRDRAQESGSGSSTLPEGEPFAQLNFQLHPQAKHLSQESVQRVYWRVGNNRGSHTIPCDLESITWSSSQLLEGRSLTLKASTQKAQERLSLETTNSLHVCNLVPATTENPSLPRPVPPSAVEGLVRANGKELHPKAAVGFYDKKSKQIQLMLLARPIASEDMFDLHRGALTLERPWSPPGELEWLTVYLNPKDLSPKKLQISLAQNKTGHSGSLQANQPGHLAKLRIPTLGQGQPFSFRLRGQVDFAGIRTPSQIDLRGSAVMLEMPR